MMERSRRTRQGRFALVLALLIAGASGAAVLYAALVYDWYPAAVPPPRMWAASTMTADCRLVAFGGDVPDGSGVRTADTLLYDPYEDSWRVIPPTTRGPYPLAHAGLTWDPTRGVAVLFGGVHTSAQGNGWAFDPRRNTWSQISKTCRTCPPARYMHAQAWSEILGGTLVFGGSASMRSVLDDVWLLRATVSRRGAVSWSWTELHPDGDIGGGLPAARFGHGMIELVAGDHAGKLLIYGGWDARNNALSDTWLYDPQTNAFDEIATNAPTPRVAFGIGYLGNTVIIQGGQTNAYNRPQTFTNETWAFDEKGLYWYQLQTAASPDNGRSFHDLASNACDGSAIMFDQRSDNSWSADSPTWVLRPH